MSYSGSTVVDFFGGSGITTRVAIEEGRHSVCCDSDESFPGYVSEQVHKINGRDLFDPMPGFDVMDHLAVSHPIFASGQTRTPISRAAQPTKSVA